MNADITVRDARDDDDWDLIGLIAGCWSEYPGCILDVHGEVPELLHIATHFNELGGRFWVAELNGRLAASIGIGPAPQSRTAILHKLYVARSARRIGLGERLVGIVEQEARGRGYESIELWSDTRFHDAHRLYARLGYERRPETRDLKDLSNSIEFHFKKML